MLHGTSSYTREIHKSPSSRLPQAFISRLPETFSEEEGKILHNARNQIRVYEIEGQKVNVKKFCIPPIINRILYSIGVRTPKAKTTFLNAEEIGKRGFPTPHPFGYIIERRAGLINYSYFISEQIQGMEPIRQCKDGRMIKALAEFTARLHQAGLMHKDYTPGNILYANKNGKFTFMLVDINRFRIQAKPIGRWRSVSNLMQPFEEDEKLKAFVNEYARYREINTACCLRYVLFLRHTRNTYNRLKRFLKKLPGAYIFLNKPLGKQEQHF